MLLEIACFNFESALIAEKAGAHRIELCENYKEGGLTPSQELIQKVKTELSIPVFVMIRPRAGNFIYTDDEFKQMKKNILFCKEQKCDGFVFGILDHLYNIDVKRCEELVQLAKPLPCTFHRAFDEIKNTDEALEQLISIGFSGILSSGKANTAEEGSVTLKKLREKAKGRIIIMPGGGIRSSNVKELIRNTNASEIHSAALTGSSEFADENEIKMMLKSF